MEHPDKSPEKRNVTIPGHGGRDRDSVRGLELEHIRVNVFYRQINRFSTRQAMKTKFGFIFWRETAEDSSAFEVNSFPPTVPIPIAEGIAAECNCVAEFITAIQVWERMKL